MLQTQTGQSKIETEESLRSSRELLKQFTSHLQILREEEKVNLSRELHDSLGQSLAGLKKYLVGIYISASMSQVALASLFPFLK